MLIYKLKAFIRLLMVLCEFTTLLLLYTGYFAITVTRFLNSMRPVKSVRYRNLSHFVSCLRFCAFLSSRCLEGKKSNGHVPYLT